MFYFFSEQERQKCHNFINLLQTEFIMLIFNNIAHRPLLTYYLYERAVSYFPEI